MNIFYIFQDPMGIDSCKAGLTSSPAVRLGVYQNSYSARSHIAQFDYAFVGTKNAISKLESRVKQDFDWDIERDGRGFSEWIDFHTNKQVLEKVQEIINSCHYKVQAVPTELLPITVDNLDDIQDWVDSLE